MFRKLFKKQTPAPISEEEVVAVEEAVPEVVAVENDAPEVAAEVVLPLEEPVESDNEAIYSAYVHGKSISVIAEEHNLTDHQVVRIVQDLESNR